MKRKRGAQPGNRNARKHGFYSPTLSPEEVSRVWTTVNLKGMSVHTAVIRVKLEAALQHDPGNHRLLEDTAKLVTKWNLQGRRVDAFDRRQFRAAISSVLEMSHLALPAAAASIPQAEVPTGPNEAGRAQTSSRDESRLSEPKARRRTKRACQAQMPKQDQSSVR